MVYASRFHLNEGVVEVSKNVPYRMDRMKSDRIPIIRKFAEDIGRRLYGREAVDNWRYT
jgi:hypothetical protein